MRTRGKYEPHDISEMQQSVSVSSRPFNLQRSDDYPILWKGATSSTHVYSYSANDCINSSKRVSIPKLSSFEEKIGLNHFIFVFTENEMLCI